MNAITKERIKLFIKNPLDNGLTRGEQMELARIALASLEAEAVMFCISGQNVDSEEHVSTSKAVVDAWLKNGIRLTEVLANHCTKLCHSTITLPCQRR